MAVTTSTALKLPQNQDASETRDHAHELDALPKLNECDFEICSYELSTAETLQGPTVGSIANMETLGVLIKAQGAE